MTFSYILLAYTAHFFTFIPLIKVCVLLRRVQCQKYLINMQLICKKFVDYNFYDKKL